MTLSSRCILAALLLALVGCNIAVSDVPVFGEAQRSSVRLKDGYWAIAERDCHYDAAQPVNSWPGCADWMIIADNQIVRERDKNVLGVEPRLLIADGKPLIAQVLSKSEKSEAPYYTFAAIEPKAIAPTGQIAAMDLWIITAVGNYPGFDADCRPRSIQALRAAAAASRPHQDEMIVAKWVRATVN